MRRLAIISDVHANLEALRAVMTEIEGQETYCLGDVVGYGANPNEVLYRLRDSGARIVRGNHDDAAVSGETGWFNSKAAMAVVWTRSKLTDDNLKLLASLPLDIRIEFEQCKTFLTHGSPDEPLKEYVLPGTHSDLFPYYLSKTDSRVIALGHTHVPFLWEGNVGVVFNPGSVGQPRDGDPRASYAILTIESGRATIVHKRVKYDTLGAARKILDAGLPEIFAKRLLVGS